MADGLRINPISYENLAVSAIRPISAPVAAVKPSTVAEAPQKVGTAETIQIRKLENSPVVDEIEEIITSRLNRVFQAYDQRDDCRFVDVAT
ncbi:MAG: hypothetical protein ACYS8X_01735 [Planctomycetota bacterium]|jgi:hypothetical protein